MASSGSSRTASKIRPPSAASMPRKSSRNSRAFLISSAPPMNAVAGITNVKVLSSPKVMVLENKTATLQIGDQLPVVTSNAQSVAAAGAPLVQTIQYFDTGVILKVTPQV